MRCRGGTRMLFDNICLATNFSPVSAKAVDYVIQRARQPVLVVWVLTQKTVPPTEARFSPTSREERR